MQGQRQTLVQQQRLSLSPRMVQSIRLMAMPFAEMRERILEEVEANPALEIVRDPVMAPPRTFDILPRATSYIQQGADDESDEHRNFIEGVLHHDETLQESLLSQLTYQTAPAAVLQLASLVIQNLDRNGFHLVPPEELSLHQDSLLLNSALELVRTLEPRGCATRDFTETLVVQAKMLGRGPEGWRDDPILFATVKILEEHFDLLGRGKPESLIRGLAKLPDSGLSIDLEDAEAVFDVVRSLDPYPGRAFDHAPDSFIVPDVYVRRDEDDFYVVINEEHIPILGIAPFFMDIESSDHSSAGQTGEIIQKETRDFARESVREAQWFISTLSRRNLTILKVARALIIFQRDFFLYGPTRLTPLRMKDIAQEVGLHEATVSRAANGKYLQCEWGIFELRYFFSNQVGSNDPSPFAPRSALSASKSGPAGSTGGLYSKQGVKEILREMIENSTETFSDQKLADQLAMRGIKIARRTVAKYRSELNINSSFDR